MWLSLYYRQNELSYDGGCLVCVKFALRVKMLSQTDEELLEMMIRVSLGN